MTPTNGVVSDGIDSKCALVTATALHSKLIMKGTIDSTYKDAHNILATATDGYEVLKLLMNQLHPLLAFKNIATVDIPKYSTYCSLFGYAREINQYVKNHASKSRVFSAREMTHIFLSQFDNTRYTAAVSQCKAAILLSLSINKIYCVFAKAGTIDQLAPDAAATTNQTRNQSRNRDDTRIRSMVDYYHNDEIPDFDS